MGPGSHLLFFPSTWKRRPRPVGLQGPLLPLCSAEMGTRRRVGRGEQQQPVGPAEVEPST